MCDLCSFNESSEIAAGFAFSGLGCSISLKMPLWGPGDEKMKGPLTSLLELDYFFWVNNN